MKAGTSMSTASITWYLDEGSGPTVVLLHGAALAVDAHITWFPHHRSR